MKLLWAAAIAVFLILATNLHTVAQTPIFPRPIQTTAFNKGTLTTGGAAQTVTGWTLVFAGTTNGLPNVFRCIQNPSSATEDLFVAMGATASTTTGQDLPAGAYWCGIWPNNWSVFAATTGHTFLMSEYQY